MVVVVVGVNRSASSNRWMSLGTQTDDGGILNRHPPCWLRQLVVVTFERLRGLLVWRNVQTPPPVSGMSSKPVIPHLPPRFPPPAWR